MLYFFYQKIYKETKFGKNFNYCTEDFHDNKTNHALAYIQKILESEQMSCKDFGLPEPDKLYLSVDTKQLI